MSWVILHIKFTFSTTCLVKVLVQLPGMYPPQSPVGLPKSANVIELMTFFLAHWSTASGFRSWNFCCRPGSLFHCLTSPWKKGETEVQILSLFTVSIVMPSGSPPDSSNTTIRLFLLFNHSRGMWYLRNHLFRGKNKISRREIQVTKQLLTDNNEVTQLRGIFHPF